MCVREGDPQRCRNARKVEAKGEIAIFHSKMGKVALFPFKNGRFCMRVFFNCEHFWSQFKNKTFQGHHPSPTRTIVSGPGVVLPICFGFQLCAGVRRGAGWNSPQSTFFTAFPGRGVLPGGLAVLFHMAFGWRDGPISPE